MVKNNTSEVRTEDNKETNLYPMVPIDKVNHDKDPEEEAFERYKKIMMMNPSKER